MGKLNEIQKVARNKIGYESFILTIVLIVLNGIVKLFYVYANSSFVEAYIMIFITIMYFSIRITFLKDDLRDPRYKPLVIAIIHSLLVLNFLFLALFNEHPMISRGRITLFGLYIIVCIGFALSAINSFYHYLKDKKQKRINQ